MLAAAGTHDEDVHEASLLAPSARSSAAESLRKVPFPLGDEFDGLGKRHLFAVREPRVDRHEWESEWQALAPLVVDAPQEALPELDQLVERMMLECGYPVEERHAHEASEPEVVAEFLEARRITNLAETGADVAPSDIGAAVTGYRNLYEYLLTSQVS
jgi:hypothetical protein